MKKTITFIAISLIVLLFNLNVVSAKNLVLDYENNPYYFREWEDHFDSGKLTFYNLDGEVVYCVEPGLHITDNTYLESNMDILGLSDEVLESIKLIGYYGYEYPGHDTNNYRMATQELIWEKLRNINVSFWTGKNQTGNNINIENEKNEILNLINKHYLKPTIDNNLVLSKDKKYEFIDNNNVLDNYEIINDNNNLTISKDNNKLTIIGEIGEYNITLKKIKYDNKKSILYVGSDGISQKMMKLRMDEEILYNINIKIVGGKIKLNKLDNDTKNNETIGNSSLKDAVYGVYDLNNNLVDKITTNELGIGSSNYLKIDKYIIKEITPSYGYELDSNIYEVELNLENLEQELNVYEKLKKVDVILIKTIEGDYSLLNGESDITFEIYFKDTNELYKKIITNKDGVCKLKLPYGEYIIHQVNTNNGYLKSDDFEILINEDNEEIFKVIYDKRIGNLKIIKIDSNTNELLSDAFIEVYDEDNSLIYSGYTNEDGSIEIKDLLIGKYKVIEKEAPDGYILSNMEYIVDINKDKIDYVLEISNEKIEIEVPSTDSSEKRYIKILGIFSLFIGIVFLSLRQKSIDKKQHL